MMGMVPVHLVRAFSFFSGNSVDRVSCVGLIGDVEMVKCIFVPTVIKSIGDIVLLVVFGLIEIFFCSKY